MIYQGYNVALHTISATAGILYLHEKLEHVESINATDRLPEPNIMLRQLGKWTQEFYSPLRWKNADKLIMQHDREAAQICVYFESLLHPQLTIRYHRSPSRET